MMYVVTVLYTINLTKSRYLLSMSLWHHHFKWKENNNNNNKTNNNDYGNVLLVMIIYTQRHKIHKFVNIEKTQHLVWNKLTLACVIFVQWFLLHIHYNEITVEIISCAPQPATQIHTDYYLLLHVENATQSVESDMMIVCRGGYDSFSPVHPSQSSLVNLSGWQDDWH